ncbi:pyridoxamine 5'-phosphate oxidase family protein [Nonomuraea sp. NN258]|uniref:pyridoxamine 5'-phosphate oxidase family protein n=1 Tax=Nonomuraea antri TaxID=2730852 RepID=UPI001568C1C9|nr:pyridoxamine 5'-phosphate oxidase family protein [Nonomuraea antri]NRQ38386.1 pyridoxamine 5'-phosphate oxidase family protein [Nonomuraea antri]
MTGREPVETANLDRYDHEALPWSRARERLEIDLAKMSTPSFLATVRPDGRPHSAGIGAMWVADALYFTSGPETRKSRNLAANPACTVSVRLEGIDLVLEGTASRVTDAATLDRIAGVYSDTGWPAERSGESLTAPYSAPSAGPPPWHLYRLTLGTAVGVAWVEPYGATRWRFAP